MANSKAEMQGQARGEAAKQKLQQAALELFGEHGFDGASTRDIADRAQQNIGAISYYFGNKEGLYAAVLADCMGHKEGDFSEQAIEELLNDKAHSQDRILGVLKQKIRCGILNMAKEDKETRSFMKLMFREQFAPTEAFKRLYKELVVPRQEPFTRLVAAYLDLDPGDIRAILTAHALIGPYIGFRVAPEIVRLKTGWKTIGGQEAALIADMLTEQLELTLTSLRAKKEQS